MLAYHFAGSRLRDGRPYPKDGVTLTHTGALVPGRSGLHAALHPLDALPCAPGDALCRVRLGGAITYGRGVYVAAERTVLRRIDAGPLLADFARQCALACTDAWRAPRAVVVALESSAGPPPGEWAPPVYVPAKTPRGHAVLCARAAFSATRAATLPRSMRAGDAAWPAGVARFAWLAASAMQHVVPDARSMQADWLQAQVDLAFQLP